MREIPAIQRRFDSGELTRLHDGRVSTCIHGETRYYSSGRSASVALWRGKNNDKYKLTGRLYRANNKESLAAHKKAYYYATQEQRVSKSREYYRKNKAKQKAYRDSRKHAYLQHKRNYRRKHIQVVRQRARDYAKRNPHIVARNNAKRRALTNGCKVVSEAVNKLYEIAQSGEFCACFYCGVMVRGGEIHLDHIIPLSRGGSHTPENLCFSCAACNLSKSNKTPEEWRASLA